MKTDGAGNDVNLYDSTTIFDAGTNRDNGRYMFHSMDASIGRDTKNLWLYAGTGDYEDVNHIDKPGEPKMDKRGLRNSIGAPKKLPSNFKSIMDFLIYADGSELIDISEKINMNIFESNEIVKILLKEKEAVRATLRGTGAQP